MLNWKISLSLFSLITGVFISVSALSQPIVPKIFLLTASENLNGQNGLPGADCDANGGNGRYGLNCAGVVTDHHHKHYKHHKDSDNTNGDNNKQTQLLNRHQPPHAIFFHLISAATLNDIAARHHQIAVG